MGNQMHNHRNIYHTSILLLTIAWDLVGVHGQSSTTQLGCTFADGGYVYNIELVPVQQDLACPSEEFLTEYEATTGARVNEVYETSRALRQLADRLTAQQVQLKLLIARQEEQVMVAKIEVAEKQGLTECPAGYTTRSDEFKSCYMFVGEYLDWYSAEDFCLSTGGHLVGLETEAEQNFLINYVQSQNVLPGKHLWTGGNDIAKEGQWIWAGVNKLFNFTSWLLYPHEDHGLIQMPDNHLEVEHCVHLFHLHDYDWNDLWCGNLHYFVCEFKLLI